MIDLKNDFHAPQEILEEILRKCELMHDIANDVEFLVREAKKKEEFMTAQEVKELLRIENGSIPKAIPNFRAGAKWLYDRKDIQDFIDRGKQRGR